MRRLRNTGEVVSVGMKHSSYQKYSLTPRGQVLAMPVTPSEDLSSEPTFLDEEAITEVVEGGYPSADEIVEGFLRKLIEYEDRAIEDGDIIKDQIDEITQLKRQVDDLQLKVNERRSIVSRLASRI
jgi:hypothetical protein